MSQSTERWHGTPGGYTNHNCHCDQCKTAWRGYQETRRDQRRLMVANGYTDFTHNANGYSNWGCRCVTCATAHQARQSAYWHRTKNSR